MKIRIRKDSLRLRLDEAEVQAFIQTGVLEERLSFDDGELVFALIASPEASRVGADLQGGRIRVTVPAGRAREWAESSEVEIQNDPADTSLRITVERDLPG